MRTTYTKKLLSTSVVTEGRIMGEAERLGCLNQWYVSSKQGANHRVIEMTAGNATADYPSSALAYREQARMDVWKNGFTLKQRNAAKALAGVPEEGQPGEFTVKRFRAVVLGEHASDHVFFDVDSERFVDLLRDPGAAKMGVALSPKAPTVGSFQQGPERDHPRGLSDPALHFSVMRITDDSCGLIEHDETWGEWRV